MIRSLQLRNFKAWSELNAEFGRITGLFGTNSSGKSSLIQFLLMLKQTKTNPDRGLVLDFGQFGQLVDLGSFRDVIHRHDETLDLEWEIHWTAPEPVRLHDAMRSSRDTLVASNALSIETAVGRAEESEFLATRCLRYTLGGLAFGLELRDDARKGFKLTPERGSGGPFEFIRNPGRGWELPGPVKTHLFPDQAKTYYQNADLLSDLEVAYETLIDRLFYLGPLRDYPRRQYTWTGSSPTDVGSRGELTINAIMAATAAGKTVQMRKRARYKPFQEAIAERLKDMGMIGGFSVAEIAQGSNLYQAKVWRDSASPEVLLTDVGFGVSQVLPAIALLNYVPPGALVILEQPEIHLHPAVQSALADAIIDIAEARDLQVVVESHSEHLLRRLQRRVAEERIPADFVKLYFVSQHRGEARIADIGLNTYGEIEHWPEGFFGDEMAEIAETRKAALRRKAAAAQ